MNIKLRICSVITFLLASICYGSVEQPITREEFERKVEQQQDKIEELEKTVSEQKKQILDLEWQIYHLKHKPEPDETTKTKDGSAETEKLRAVIREHKAEIARLRELCLRARIDPNSDPNKPAKLRTEREEKEYQKKLEAYRDYFKKEKSYKPKPKVSPLPQSKDLARLSDAEVIALVEKTLTEDGILDVTARVADGRRMGGVKCLIVSFRSRDLPQNESEPMGVLWDLPYIVGVYVGARRDGWDVDELMVVVGDITGRATGTFYCEKEWADNAIKKPTVESLGELCLMVFNTFTPL